MIFRSLREGEEEPGKGQTMVATNCLMVVIVEWLERSVSETRALGSDDATRAFQSPRRGIIWCL
jgi:hypothetical protein